MHLSYLTTFEVVASTSSFTQAAKLLHITVGAVSQQMCLLEQQLGICLFIRHSRGVNLSPKGVILYKEVQVNLGNLRQIIKQLTNEAHDTQEIRLKLTPSFAFKWLVPRLENFYSQHPNIKVQTFAEAGLVDHSNTDVDLTIDYGTMPYHNNQAKLLLAEQLTPVMSPAYFTNSDTFWLHARLLHDATPYQGADKRCEWQYWLLENKIITNNTDDHFFNRTDMAMAAAEAGLGIAMARQALIGDEINQGKLVAPFASIAANAGYYLIEHNHNPAIATFCCWLIDTLQPVHS